MPELTSAEWATDPKYAGIEILDPDGWDRQNWDYSYNLERITREEFEHRLAMSTCKFTKEALERLAYYSVWSWRRKHVS